MDRTEKLLSDLEDCRRYSLLMLGEGALDDGDDDTARAWAWLAEHRRWPSQGKDGLYRWRPQAAGGEPDRREDAMPRAVLGAMGVSKHEKVAELLRHTAQALAGYLKTVGPWQTGL
jgi:hypothetical protein